MAEPISTDIAIVGAGIIGLATAFRLTTEGCAVTVIDPNEPGYGASFGNAGVLAPYAVAPVGNPDVLRNLPRLLLGPQSPFAINWAGLPPVLPWMVRFARHSLPGPARRNAVALAALQKDSMQAWRELAQQAGLLDLMQYEGCLYYFQGRMPDRKRSWSARLRDQLSVRQDWLSATQVAKLEPALPPAAGGIYFPDAAHIVDPGLLSRRLWRAAEAHGAVFLRARAERLEMGDANAAGSSFPIGW
jgi:D-amino-acid dehydrogenase